MGGFEQFHIVVELPPRDQGTAEAVDGQIGHAEQVGEFDPEIRPQALAVVRAQRLLIRRQGRADRIEHQMQRQRAIGFSVAERIQALEALDRGVENAAAALLVDILARVTRQRGDNLHLVLGEKLGQTLHLREFEHGQVTAIHHVDPATPRLRDQKPELAMEFGRTPGDVEGAHIARIEEVHHLARGLVIHHLLARGPRIHVAVKTGLVAVVTDVHLQRADRAPGQRREVMRIQMRKRCMH